MFPPTRKNLHLMRIADAQRGKLARIGKDLEGGLIFKSTSSQALYIPVGCIHAVFTLHVGFLLSIEFSTPDSVPVLATLLNSDFDRFDMIIGMDDQNIKDLKLMARSKDDLKKIFRMTDFCTQNTHHFVPDPYYSGSEGFEIVLDLLEDACLGLILHLEMGNRSEL